jgi:asparagine synthetase B (glutamine-hydrolysing)
MCGIAGIWDRRLRRTPDTLAKIAEAMADAIAHRGPDAGTTWIDPEPGIAFGHRRLRLSTSRLLARSNGVFLWSICHFIQWRSIQRR